MNSKCPLRRKGPNVYISYAFKDEALATSINQALTERGLQVKLDNAESLISQHLSTTLASRIEQAEVFICLATSTANQSEWCRKEVDIAIARAIHSSSPKFLPVVFATENLYKPISEWSYIDATHNSSPTSITPSIIERIYRECLKVVVLLPLSEEEPTRFDYGHVKNLMENGLPPNKRVILDSNGLLQTAMEEAMASFEQIQDKAIRNSVLAQEAQRHERVRKCLDIDELLFPMYFDFLNECLSGYSDRLEIGERATRNYVRLTLSLPLLRVTSMYNLNASNSTLRQYESHLRTAAAGIEDHQSLVPSIGGYGEIAWALCGAGEKHKFMQIGLDARHDKEGITLYVPEDSFNEGDRVILQIGESAEAMLTQWTWLDYALPQIAVRARNYMLQFGLSIEETQNTIGWKISDYRRVGMP
jgi:hypothetical protein